MSDIPEGYDTHDETVRTRAIREVADFLWERHHYQAFTDVRDHYHLRFTGADYPPDKPEVHATKDNHIVIASDTGPARAPMTRADVQPGDVLIDAMGDVWRANRYSAAFTGLGMIDQDYHWRDIAEPAYLIARADQPVTESD